MTAPKVRAKFFVSNIQNHQTGNPDDFYATVTLMPVFGTYGDGKENESWSRYTPSGEIRMSITNPAAVDALELGKAYFVDFTPAS